MLHHTVFTSIVQRVRVAAGRHTLKMHVLLQKLSWFQLPLLRHWHIHKIGIEPAVSSNRKSNAVTTLPPSRTNHNGMQ